MYTRNKPMATSDSDLPRAPKTDLNEKFSFPMWIPSLLISLVVVGEFAISILGRS